ncbi:MAG: O-acetylhomoserine aminocarboxypropyltransferase/cysteine synthase family protein [Terriglobales bacterium]
MNGFATKAIHGRPLKPDPHGTLRPPVYDNVAFEFAGAQDLQLAFEGRKPAHSYSRISNPTVEEYEQRVRLLADAFGVIAVSSGMAAISNVLMALGQAGTNIVTTRWVFGNTYSLLEHTFKPWGLDVNYVDLADPRALAEAINEQTRAVFLEVITNPQLQVVDIPEIARIAHERGVPVVLDGTVTTPYLFRSKDFGVDVEVISSTKYISGGATSVGGLILDNGTFDWKQNPKLRPWAKKVGPGALLTALRRELYRNLGACLSPHNAFLQTLGLETLSLRIDKSCANTLTLARWLKRQHPKVVAVNYPGLESSPCHCLATRLFPRGAGGILTFDLGSREQCFAFADALKVVRRATNINDNKTLILHPASTIFCEYTAEQKAAMGVSDSMLRLSVGIEDVEDIIEDLAGGLAAL